MKQTHLYLISAFFAAFLFSPFASAAGIVVVAKSGGDFSSPVAAMASITDASPSNPYVVFIEPGRYNLGSTPLYMKSHVSLVGSGQKATYIVGRVDSAVLVPAGGPGLVNGADHSEIRNLTVINSFDGTSHAIHNLDASPLIENVTALGRGANTSGFGFKAGIWDDGNSASQIRNSIARGIGTGNGTCIGLFSRDSATWVQDSRIIARDCGINNGVALSESGSVNLHGTTVSAQSTAGIDNGLAVTSTHTTAATAKVLDSRISGAVTAGGGVGAATVRIASSLINGGIFEAPATGADIKCVHSFDADFDPLDSDCVPVP